MDSWDVKHSHFQRSSLPPLHHFRLNSHFCFVLSDIVISSHILYFLIHASNYVYLFWNIFYSILFYSTPGTNNSTNQSSIYLSIYLQCTKYIYIFFVKCISYQAPSIVVPHNVTHTLVAIFRTKLYLYFYPICPRWIYIL